MGHCCGKRNLEQSKRNEGAVCSAIKSLPRHLVSSVLCGIMGSATFLIALTTAIQTAIFLRMHKDIAHDTRTKHEEVLKHAVKSLNKGWVPALEMFVIVPLVFFLSHKFASFNMLECIIMCWATMFLVCVLARVTGIVKETPSLQCPPYSKTYPFARVSCNSSSLDFGFASYPEINSNEKESQTSKWLKALFLGVVFTPLRVVVLVANIVLLMCEIIHFFASILYNTANATYMHLASRFRGDGKHQNRALADLKSDAKSGAHRLAHLAHGIISVDLPWVATLGIRGAFLIFNAAHSNTNDPISEKGVPQLGASSEEAKPQTPPGSRFSHISEQTVVTVAAAFSETSSEVHSSFTCIGGIHTQSFRT